MTTYGFLILPAMNKVYGRTSLRLTQAELKVVNEAVLSERLTGIGERSIAGVPYVTFECGGLGRRQLAHLSNLSSVYALFELGAETLRPVALSPLDRFDDDLLTIQKYVGKTNEHFTKLLLNVTLACSEPARDLPGRKLAVLDPLCGRGTSLNQAMMYGFDASGMELDAKSFESYAHFITTWLRDKRLKHRAEQSRIRRNRKTVARRLRISLAARKDDFKAGRTQEIEVVNDDTRNALDHFPEGSFDAIVADLPYGIQHGSRVAGSGAARNPAELLREALPRWTALLRKGSAMGLSWNTRVLGHASLVELLEQSGLRVVDSPAFREFRHRVDQSIVRDLLVAVRP